LRQRYGESVIAVEKITFLGFCPLATYLNSVG